MNKYEVTLEYWDIDGVFNPARDDFFEWALANPNGCYASEVIATFDTKKEALATLAKYKCSSKKHENYNETTFKLYAVEELIYDEDGDVEDYKFIQYADIEIC